MTYYRNTEETPSVTDSISLRYLRLKEKANRERGDAEGPRSVPNDEDDRAKFWGYCQRVIPGSRQRAKGIPHDIDAYFVDRLLADQNLRCAISGIRLRTPGAREPFGPSLDRIVPERGYVRGNVRIVCNIVNVAMSNWGLDPFCELVAAMVHQAGIYVPPPLQPAAER